MKSIRVALFLLLCGCASARAAVLGAVWTPVVPEARAMWLRSEGTLDAGSYALMAGPTIATEAISLDGTEVVRPAFGGVPRVQGVPPPRTGHTILSRDHRAVPPGRS